MASLLTTTRVTEPALSLSQHDISALERTCSNASAPIWVSDLWDRCVYRNQTAAEALPSGCRPISFELVDHAGRTIGHLATLGG